MDAPKDSKKGRKEGMKLTQQFHKVVCCLDVLGMANVNNRIQNTFAVVAAICIVGWLSIP